MTSRSVWYLYAMERLVGVVQELSLARDMNTISTIIRNAARNLTGADGATFVLRDGDQCYYADENAIAPLWKGKRFPMNTCISGWVMEHGEPVVIQDIYKDRRIPADLYRPTFVKSMAMVPIRRNAPIGAIGNYWATNRLPTKEEVAILQALADTASVAIANAELYSQLQQQVHTLSNSRSVFRINAKHWRFLPAPSPMI
jgi:GAF domain-containing protein